MNGQVVSFLMGFVWGIGSVVCFMLVWKGNKALRNRENGRTSYGWPGRPKDIVPPPVPVINK